ncbi:MAG: hypothetical protein WAO83_02715 [Fuerstiella sp.]
MSSITFRASRLTAIAVLAFQLTDCQFVEAFFSVRSFQTVEWLPVDVDRTTGLVGFLNRLEMTARRVWRCGGMEPE